MTHRLVLNALAPDFELQDENFFPVKLSKFRGKKNIVLSLMRGFVDPFCRAQLAQLSKDYEYFLAQNAEIIAIGPDGPMTFKRYWMENNLHFIGLPDIKSAVAILYQQEDDMFQLGRVPAIFIIDKKGKFQYVHYGDSMSDIPTNQDLLNTLERINLEQG